MCRSVARVSSEFVMSRLGTVAGYVQEGEKQSCKALCVSKSERGRGVLRKYGHVWNIRGRGCVLCV